MHENTRRPEAARAAFQCEPRWILPPKTRLARTWVRRESSAPCARRATCRRRHARPETRRSESASLRASKRERRTNEQPDGSGVSRSFHLRQNYHFGASLLPWFQDAVTVHVGPCGVRTATGFGSVAAQSSFLCLLRTLNRIDYAIIGPIQIACHPNNSPAASAAKNAPPTKPSHDFPGETVGINL